MSPSEMSSNDQTFEEKKSKPNNKIEAQPTQGYKYKTSIMRKQMSHTLNK